MKELYFWFYCKLNLFLPDDEQKWPYRHRFKGRQSIKDRIETVGVPHTEVKLILAKYLRRFKICQECDKIYWEGSHYKNMEKLFAKINNNS